MIKDGTPITSRIDAENERRAAAVAESAPKPRERSPIVTAIEKSWVGYLTTGANVDAPAPITPLISDKLKRRDQA